MERPFGQGQGEASILLSHAHWDHIQGFPFFVPMYRPGNRFTIFGGAKLGDARGDPRGADGAAVLSRCRR